MSNLKPGWRRVKFGDVVRLVRDICKDPAAEGIERFIGLEHLEPGDLRVRSWGNIADGTTFTNRVRPGQVLFGKRRAYQRKVALAEFEAVCSGDIYVLESADSDKLLPELVPFICQMDAFVEHAVGTSAGSLSPRTNWSKLAGYEFSLPPPEDQQRAAQIFEAFQEALEVHSRLELAARSQRHSLARDLFATPSTRYPLREAVTSSAYGPRFPGSDYDANGNVHTLRTTDFSADGGFRFESVPAARVDEHVAEQHRLQDGDFLLSRSGEYAGMTRVFRGAEAPERCFIPAAFLIRFRLDQSLLLPSFLHEFCESPTGIAMVRSLAQGSAQPNISGTRFLELSIPQLTLAQQQQVCASLATLRSVERQLDARREALLALRRASLAIALMEVA